jgi:hypothetical protein
MEKDRQQQYYGDYEMSFTGNYMATSFKQELMVATHNFTTGQHAFKLALYDSNASFTAATTDYTVTDEVTGTGYTAGGGTLTNVTPTSAGTTAFTDFADLVFSTVTITARGCMIYNSTAGTNAVVILDFGADKSASVGDFTIQFPTADATNAIIRIA